MTLIQKLGFYSYENYWLCVNRKPENPIKTPQKQ